MSAKKIVYELRFGGVFSFMSVVDIICSRNATLNL
jgi:hypothetical protein